MIRNILAVLVLINLNYLTWVLSNYTTKGTTTPPATSNTQKLPQGGTAADKLVASFQEDFIGNTQQPPNTRITVSPEAENVTRFLDNLFNGYDRRIRPNHKKSPVNVTVSIYVNSFASVSETTMDYRLTFFLRNWWNDPRLVFKDSSEDVISLHHSMFQKIWCPDIYFTNEKTNSIDKATTHNKLLRIYKNGDIYSRIRLSMSLDCAMHLQNFPMDIQTCKMQLESVGYELKDLALEWKNDTVPIHLSKFLALPEFTILGYKPQSCTKFHEGSFSCIEVVFILKREMGSYVIQTYVPSTFIVIISWVAFWINMDSAPARTALGITTVLTMTTLSSGTKSTLPKVSYVKAIDVWMAVCLLFVFSALVEFAMVDFVSRRSKKLPSIRRKSKNNENQETPNDAKSLSRHYRRKAQRIDAGSRILFPLVFIIFNIFYWIYYKMQKNVEKTYMKGAIPFDSAQS